MHIPRKRCIPVLQLLQSRLLKFWQQFELICAKIVNTIKLIIMLCSLPKLVS